jgi:hypothetical protein
MSLRDPALAFLASLPQFHLSKHGDYVIHLSSGAVVRRVANPVDGPQFNVRWPGQSADVQVEVPIDTYVRYQQREAEQLGHASGETPSLLEGLLRELGLVDPPTR